MKKIALCLWAIAFVASFKAAAQSGINTTIPKATLDIVAKNTTGSTTNVDGLLIPRVDRQRAQSMASVPTSTLVYIDNVSTGTATGATANVDVVGYYYYNGTAWAKLDLNGNIYNANGTLTANRTVTQAGNTLAFTATATNAFSVDGSTFSVDAANNRVGIGTAAPTAGLHVQGNARITNIPASASANDVALVADANGNIFSRTANTSRSSVLVNNASYNWTDSTTLRDMYFADFNVTVTLPKTNISSFSGKLLRFYIYGGGANLTLIGIASQNSAGAASGFTYSTVGGVFRVNISGEVNRFNFVEVFCDGTAWWVDNRN